MLAHRDKFGRRDYIWRPGFWNPDQVGFDTVFACGVGLCEMISQEEKTQIAGVTSLCDGSNFGFKQFRNFSLEDTKYSAAFCQEHFPLWFRQIHCVNFPRLLKVSFDAMKPFLDERTKNMIVFHDTNESLH